MIDRIGANRHAIGRLQLRDLVVVQDGQTVPGVGLAHQLDHAPRQSLRRAPDDVVSRQCVAIALHATFDPIHRWHEGESALRQPVIDLYARVLHIVGRPLAGQYVVLSQLAKAQPVSERNFRRVLDLHAPLHRGIDQCHAAERPQGQTPQSRGCVAVHQGDGFASSQAFDGRHDAGQATANHQHVRLNRFLHCCLLPLFKRVD